MSKDNRTSLEPYLADKPPLVRLWWWLVMFGFRLLYNEMAWTYDLVSWLVSLGQWRTWQRTALAHLGLPAKARILEIAFGTGNLQLDLFAAGYQRFGVDLSPFMGRIARHKLHRHHLKAPLARAYAQVLPFPNQVFDAVVSTFPAPFIIEPDTLHEARRVLKPDGRLIIVVNGVLTGGGVLRDVLETAYRITGQRGPWPAELGERFQEAGFTLEMRAHPCPYSIAYILVATRRHRAAEATAAQDTPGKQRQSVE
ncbi:MAG: methyltransferase domain-containing protein [Chloroflexi bacterium]|nr:methyltransferase domain-containing protein [Chloroflexota bacterium]